MTDVVSNQAKMIYLARRNPALAPEDFAQAWREHSALGAGCSNVRDKVLSVSQCSRVLTLPGLAGAADDYDGVNLLLMRDLQSAADIWNDAQTLATMRPDEPRVFSTYVRNFTLVCAGRILRQVFPQVAKWSMRKTLPSVTAKGMTTATAPMWLALWQAWHGVPRSLRSMSLERQAQPAVLIF